RYIPSQFYAAYEGMQEVEIDENAGFSINFEHAFPYQAFMLIINERFVGEFVLDQGFEMEIDIQKIRKPNPLYTPKTIGPDHEANELIRKHRIYTAMQRPMQNMKSRKILKDEKLSWEEKVKSLKSIHAENHAADKRYLDKYPHDYGWLALDKTKATYYAEMLDLYMGKEIEVEFLDSILNYKPLSLNLKSLSYYRSLHRFYRSISIEDRLSLLKSYLGKDYPAEDEQGLIDDFLSVYKKRLEKKEYDKETFTAGRIKYIDPYKEKIDAIRDASFSKKLSKLPQEKADLIRYAGQPGALKAREAYLSKMISQMDTSPIKNKMQQDLKVLQNKIAELDKLIGKGQELNQAHPLGTHLLDLEDKGPLYISKDTEVEAFIENVRKQYPEKAIIFDVWATWCGPCLADFRNSKEVKEQMKGLPVEVVYLCMEDNGGSNTDSWKETVANKGSKGTHIFMPRELAVKFMNHFDFNYYPSYLFIDREGKQDKKFIKRISMIDVQKLEKRL
ncbi:MAG: redoxin family protein, partial [Bacteroidota bacterium]